ncbi:MAG: 6-pyruvoyl tetrahydropterin synthase family protein [Nitrososphaerales archaeon]
MSKGKVVSDSDLRYIDGKGNLLKSRAELSVAKLLQYLSIDYEYDSGLKDGSSIRVDFRTKKGLIEVIDSQEDADKLLQVRKNSNERVIAVGHSKYASKIGEIDSFFSYDDEDLQMGSIFIEDPSLAFDYAHILPLVEKCSVLHGHTSSVMVEIIGNMKNNMVIDFGDAKKIIKSTLSALDHKFFINKKYLIGEDDEHYRVSFEGPKGFFDLKVPKNTTYMLNGEATVENLSTEIIKLLSPNMPSNIEALGVYIYEGVNKGAHIISRISRDER